MENKLASVVVMSLGKAANGMPSPLCDRQVVGASSLPVVLAQSDNRFRFVSPTRVIPKDFKKMVFTVFALNTRLLHPVVSEKIKRTYIRTHKQNSTLL